MLGSSLGAPFADEKAILIVTVKPPVTEVSAKGQAAGRLARGETPYTGSAFGLRQAGSGICCQGTVLKSVLIAEPCLLYQSWDCFSLPCWDV